MNQIQLVWFYSVAALLKDHSHSANLCQKHKKSVFQIFIYKCVKSISCCFFPLFFFFFYLCNFPSLSLPLTTNSKSETNFRGNYILRPRRERPAKQNNFIERTPRTFNYAAIDCFVQVSCIHLLLSLLISPFNTLQRTALRFL